MTKMQVGVNRALEPGVVVGKYTIGSLLSAREQSLTYMARAPEGCDIILKEFHPVALVRRTADHSLQPVADNTAALFASARGNFSATGLEISALRNPNVARVVEVFQEYNTAWMAIQFEQAFSLRELLKQTPRLDYDDIKTIAFPILDAMRVLHRKNVLHLAIDIDSILVRGDGSPLLAGFGSLYAPIPGSTAAGSDSPFVPAELIDPERGASGPWSDIYALGAVLYTCITGRAPVPAGKRLAALRADTTDPYRKLGDTDTGKFARSMLTAIDHALALLPKERPKSMGEWTQEFLALTETGDVTVIRHNDLQSVVDDDAGKYREQRYKLFMALLSGANQPYYLAAFINQDDKGIVPRARWNTGAFLFGLVWMAYRRILGVPLGLAILVAILVAISVHTLLGRFPLPPQDLLPDGQVTPTIMITLAALAVFLGFWGNYLYYLYARTRIRAAETKCPNVNSQRSWLSDRGGVSGIGAAVMACVLVGASWFMFTSTSERMYSAREPVTRAMTALKAVAWQVGDYRLGHGTWPQKAGDVLSEGYAELRGSPWDVTVYNQLVVLTFRVGASDREVPAFLVGKSMALYGSENNGKVNWRCGSIDIPLEVLPEPCRLRLK